MTETWEQYRSKWQSGLRDAVNFYLQNPGETAWVCLQTWRQAERVWSAAEGEASLFEILSRTAADQCERLLPRLPGLPERHVPTADQIFRQLEAARFEQQLKGIRERIEVAKGQARERQIDISEELALLEQLEAQKIAEFYNRRLPLDDDDEAGGAIGVLAKVGPPMRGPGSGRTFEEALALPRNP